MILTGKAKEDSLEWCKTQNSLKLGLQVPNTIGGVILDLGSNIGLMPKSFQNALIIEWFDSVGIYIDIGIHNVSRNTFNYSIHLKQKNIYSDLYTSIKTRIKATEQAIKKANEIYNNLKS